jgi:hypothetical protein
MTTLCRLRCEAGAGALGNEIEKIVRNWLDEVQNRLSIEEGGCGNTAGLATALCGELHRPHQSPRRSDRE